MTDDSVNLSSPNYVSPKSNIEKKSLMWEGESESTISDDNPNSTQKEADIGKDDKKGDDDSMDLLTRYNNLLDRRPVYTKSLTAAFVSGFGAALGSIISNQQNTRKKGRILTPVTKQSIKWLDVLAFALHGGLLNGPIGHYWFEWLEKNGPKSRIYSTLLDQLLVQPPLLVLMFVFLDSTKAAMREIPSSLSRTLSTVGPTVISSWRFWPFAVYCTLKYLKKKHYTVALNLCSVVWTAYLSKKKSRS